MSPEIIVLYDSPQIKLWPTCQQFKMKSETALKLFNSQFFLNYCKNTKTQTMYLSYKINNFCKILVHLVHLLKQLMH